MELNPNVEAAISYAAADVARAYSDAYGRTADYASIRRALVGFMSMAIVKSELGKDDWMAKTAKAEPWCVKADDPGAAVDSEVLARSVSRWWDSLDPAGQMSAVELAGYNKSQFIRNIVQKYQGKPETTLITEIPDLAATYREELGAPMRETPKP
jgi:hypothetical protein